VKTYLNPDDILQLENAARYLRDRLLIRLLFHTGCRISEALSLAVANIDFTNSTVTFENLMSRLELSCPKCGARLGKSHAFCSKCGVPANESVIKKREQVRGRTLPLDNKTLEMLADYIKRSDPVKRAGRMLIFGINRHRAWGIVVECAGKAGLPKLSNPGTGRTHNVTPQRLRVSFAAHAMKVDHSADGLRILQQHLGNVSFNKAVRYRKVSDRKQKQWAQKLWRNEAKTDGN